MDKNKHLIQIRPFFATTRGCLFTSLFLISCNGNNFFGDGKQGTRQIAGGDLGDQNGSDGTQQNGQGGPSGNPDSINPGSLGGLGGNDTTIGGPQNGGPLNQSDSTVESNASDLHLKYAAFTEGDGSPKTTATQTFDIKHAADPDFTPLSIYGLPTMIPGGGGIDGALVIPNACRCGQDNSFALRYHANAYQGTLDQAEPLMFLMGHTGPKENSADHWRDNDFVKGAPKGPHAMYIANDHPFLTSKCSTIPQFQCDSGASRRWDNMDDVRLVFWCDLSRCGSLSTSTSISFIGQDSHMID